MCMKLIKLVNIICLILHHILKIFSRLNKSTIFFRDFFIELFWNTNLSLGQQKTYIFTTFPNNCYQNLKLNLIFLNLTEIQKS